MITVGINNGYTAYGKKLKDGGTAIVSDNYIIGAVSEERVSRKKSDGGFNLSLKYLLDKSGLTLNDVDKIVYSSCCEYNAGLGYCLDLPKDKIEVAPSHHFSHACSSFLLSGLAEALIVVMDSGGDILEPMVNDNSWWKYKREQQSYYIGNGKEITLIGKDFAMAEEAGIGEIFRAFTKYLGWTTKYTGKLMSLAGLTDRNSFEHVDIYSFNNSGNLQSKIKNDPLHPIEMVKRFSSAYNLNFGNERNVSDPIQDIHIDIANYVQVQYEKFIIRKITYLLKKYNLKNLCLAGGVALNCVGNTAIAQQTKVNKIFVQPASGDQGQCLGNAIYGQTNNQPLGTIVLTDAYLGPQTDYDESTIKQLCAASKLDFIISTDSPKLMAELLFQDFILGHFYGRSEFGPRALGNRSILASPCKEATKERLNQMKNREFFNPFAACVLEEFYWDYYHACQIDNPFMLFADKVKTDKSHQIPAALHKDGTTRVQTVSQKTSLRLYSIIKEFYKLSRVPLLLNTSLNGKDEPICEKLEDAFASFKTVALDCLVSNTYFIFKPSNSKIVAFLKERSLL